MAKQLACGDVVPGCTYVAKADDEADLMQQVAKHASEAHGVKQSTPDLRAKVKAGVKDA